MRTAKNKVKTLLGSNIKKYRLMKELSQEELAEKVECNPKYLSDVETGKVFASSESIERIADILQVPISFLFQDNKERAELEKSIEQIVDDETIRLAVVLKKRIREL